MKRFLILAAACFLLAAPAAYPQNTLVTGTFKTQQGQTPAQAGLSVKLCLLAGVLSAPTNGACTGGATALYGDATFDAHDMGAYPNLVRELTINGVPHYPGQVHVWIKGDGTIVSLDGSAGVRLIPTIGASPAGLAYCAEINFTGSAANRLSPVQLKGKNFCKAIPDQASVDWGTLSVASIITPSFGYQTGLAGAMLNYENWTCVTSASVPTPAAGFDNFFCDSADTNKLKRKISDGSVVLVEGGGGAVLSIDAVNLSSQSALNFQDTTEIDWTNPSAGNVQIALKAASIADSKLTSNYSGIGACAANQWSSTLNDNAAPTCTQPGFSNLSGSIALAQTPLTTLGDMEYVNVTPALARLPGNTTTTKQFLTQTGTGAVSAAPAWAQPAVSDLAAATSAQLAAVLSDEYGTTGVFPRVDFTGAALNDIVCVTSITAPTVGVCGNSYEYSDSLFRVVDNTDATKKLAIEVSAIPTGTTRTWTLNSDGSLPDAAVANNITVDLATLATTATTANAGDSATAFFSTGALELAIGGTNQTSWTASRCVQVNAGGTALESAAAACGAGGGGDSVQFNATDVTTTINFLNVTATGSVAGVTWTHTPASPDTATFALSAASASVAGIVDTGTQTFGGLKTFSSLLTASEFRLSAGAGTVAPTLTSSTIRFGALDSSGTTAASTFRGSDTLGANAAGNAILRPGGSSNATPGAPGRLIIEQTAIKGATVTSGAAVCISADTTVADCATSATNPAGVAVTTADPILVQFLGVNNIAVPYDFTSAGDCNGTNCTTTIGHFVCTSANVAGKVQPQTAPCAQGRKVGTIWKAEAGVTSATAGTILLATAAPFTLVSADIPNNAANTSGLAGTATALAADPTGCTNQVVTDIAAAGTLTCTTITSAHTSGTFTATAHNLLSAIHGDSTVTSAVRGSIIYANSTPAWTALGVQTAGKYPKWDGTDVVASTLAAAGVGTCTNQFARALNADAAPTCATVVAADVDTTITKNSAANTGAAAMTLDMAASTSATAFKPPAIAGANPSTTPAIAYDTTQQAFVGGAGAAAVKGFFPRTISVQVPASDGLVDDTITTVETAFATTYTIPTTFFNVAGKTLRFTIGFDFVMAASSPTAKLRVRLTNASGTRIFEHGWALTTSVSSITGYVLQCTMTGTAAAGASVNVVTSCASQGTMGAGYGNDISSVVALPTNGAIVLVPTLTYGSNPANTHTVYVRSMIVEEVY